MNYYERILFNHSEDNLEFFFFRIVPKSEANLIADKLNEETGRA